MYLLKVTVPNIHRVLSLSTRVLSAWSLSALGHCALDQSVPSAQFCQFPKHLHQTRHCPPTPNTCPPGRFSSPPGQALRLQTGSNLAKVTHRQGKSGGSLGPTYPHQTGEVGGSPPHPHQAFS